MIIFIGLAVASVAAALMFVLGDYGFGTKCFFVLATVAALIMQFVPPVSANVHFLVPMGLQILVVGSFAIASQFE